jgi:hypothetical protein
MNPKFLLPILMILMINFFSCRQKESEEAVRIIFLHHSTGQNIWDGNRSTFLSSATSKISTRLSWKLKKRSHLPLLFDNFNQQYNKKYIIKDLIFPKEAPYGWHNYPFDYYNIWVKNAGMKIFMQEPTLEILTKDYNVIILKHCFPVSNIQVDRDSSDINSDYKSLANYKLQYIALREKFLQYPDTKFIVFTGAAQIKSNISEEEAIRAKEFFNWVVNEWDLPDDNIYIWDFFQLQTDGDIYFNGNNAFSLTDSHPNDNFSGYASDLLFNRIIDVIENNGARTTLTGENK